MNERNRLYRERSIPVVLMEQRIGFSKKLGRELITAMAKAVAP